MQKFRVSSPFTTLVAGSTCKDIYSKSSYEKSHFQYSKVENNMLIIQHRV